MALPTVILAGVNSLVTTDCRPAGEALQGDVAVD
jgi:hypothetical protein